ncbi:glycoside hydrolase family 88/105 protein [Paenibacillus alkalitolerans]|uniref:glycoside hydrolase family 88/105 protein n=1 Tax=Paenibacillus alkalitolerans TaxID=2799335 RepID=UPI0018F537D6|nr:glycoside hydrolase family 88 protein [Paenibacillus alkalitolerans]
MEKTNVNELADRLVSYMLQDHTGDWGMDINQWDWTPGVGLISMQRYFEVRQMNIDDLIEWVNRNKIKSQSVRVINSMAPYAIFPALYVKTGDCWYLETGRQICEWIIHEAPRTREGAFEHTVTEEAKFPEQVWADTIYMAGLLLARMGRLTQNKSYGQESLRQLLIHLRLLQDERTGVLFHGWDCGSGHHMSAARWTRANAWIVLATPLIVEELRDLLPIPSEIMERYIRMLEGLLSFQAEDGLWPTVMDRPDFYHEVSGSAGIAAGFKRSAKLGWVGNGFSNAADRTLQALFGQIGSKGEVLNVSSGTPVMPTIEDYNRIPIRPTLYGQGLALMLICEYL